MWYEEANKSRPGWKALCRRGIKSRVVSVQASGVVNRDVVCEECGRTFRRESDKKRHKCRREREKPATWSHSVWDMQEVHGSVAKVAWQFTGAHDLLETESYFIFLFHFPYGVA